MNLADKTILLTGATGGIGAAMAHRLAGGGARMVLVSRSPDKLEALLAALPGDGHAVVAADIGSPEGRAQVVDACGDALYGLINNAGVNRFGLLESLSDQQLQQIMDINTVAPIALTRDLLPVIVRNGGLIVNVGSGFGSIGFPGYCAYSASKFALRGFTEALRRELADTPVRILYLAPRATQTAMNSPEVMAMNEELGNRVDAPEAVAEELAALLQRGKGSRLVGRPERLFARLNALFPSLVDSALARQIPTIKRKALEGTVQGA